MGAVGGDALSKEQAGSALTGLVFANAAATACHVAYDGRADGALEVEDGIVFSGAEGTP